MDIRTATARLRSLQDRWRDPALTLLAVLLLVLMFIIVPLNAVGLAAFEIRLAPILFGLVAAPVLVTAIIVVSDQVTAVLAVFVAMGLIVSGAVLRFTQPSMLVTTLDMAGTLIMGCALTWVVAFAVFAPGRVTYHRVAGTLVLYLAIGATFAGMFGVLGLLVPHAFTGMPPRDDGPAVVAHVFYFSFVTLTSTGYGDIVPTYPVTRGLANLEALVGQLYPATLIARVVTLELAHRGRDS
jgi:hypothetical protein